MSLTPEIKPVEAYVTAAIALQVPRTEMMPSFGNAVRELLDVLKVYTVGPEAGRKPSEWRTHLNRRLKD